jgi:GAF domain-containing protein
MASDAAREILVRGARAVARADSPTAAIETLLDTIAAQLDIESAVIVLVDEPQGLTIAASTGLSDQAVAGLADALRNPGHPIARTVTEPVPTFDVTPTAPGGPALRSHLPLAVTRAGTDRVLGVLALAHHRPLDEDSRRILEAAADLAAVAVEGLRPDPTTDEGPGEGSGEV